MPKAGRPRKSVRNETIVLLRKQGKTFAEIGQVVGMPKSNVHQIWKRDKDLFNPVDKS